MLTFCIDADCIPITRALRSQFPQLSLPSAKFQVTEHAQEFFGVR